jgi:hypothetical protein
MAIVAAAALCASSASNASSNRAARKTLQTGSRIFDTLTSTMEWGDEWASTAAFSGHPFQLNMQSESIPALGPHSRELSVCCSTCSSESREGNSATPNRGLDAAAAAAIEVPGAMAAAALCEVRT